MAYTVHWRGKTVKAHLTDQDRALVPLAWVAEVLGAAIREDKAAAALYIEELPPLPAISAEPVGATTDPWQPVRAPITSAPGRRSAALYELVIRQFQVARNPALLPRNGATYCNIFAWWVALAMGVALPHWIDADGDPAAPGSPGARETDANGLIRWLREHGPRYGWQPCTMSETLERANAGRAVVACWENPGGIGHIAMVRPGAFPREKGPPIAQAGARNFDDGFMTDGFGYSGPLEFFWHE